MENEHFVKRTFRKQIDEFSHHWRNYVFQSLAASSAIFIVLLVLHTSRLANVAALGASSFIIFAMPKTVAAKSRNLIGGHFTGLVIGSLMGLLSTALPESLILHVAIYALAVGISIFIMVVIDMEHPPASGTALGMAVDGFSLNVAIAIVVSILILGLIHHFFKPYLKDLV